MASFLEKAQKAYSAEQYNEILKYYNFLMPLKYSSNIYNFNFGVNVASSIIDNKLDYNTVIASLIYPTKKNNINIEMHHHVEVLSLLTSLLNLEKLQISTKQEQLDSIKSMFIALAKDLRVIIIKLCIEQEKINNLTKFQADEVEQIMKNCTDIFSPLSSMLGLSQIKNKLEDASFRYYKPKLYKELSSTLEKYFEERNNNINETIVKIKSELTPIIPNVVVYGRQKQLASIAKKLQKKNMSISSISGIYGRNNSLEKIVEENNFKDITLHYICDILAIRILVDTVDQCYSVLGKIFTMFTPLGNYKDYIAHPKDNGYQSLHTGIILESGDPMEVQIRTFEMHNYAEYGFAAHWAYKENKKINKEDARLNYIRSVLELYKDRSSDELLDALKADVYAGKIFVQSPMGKILEFPEGATPIDFAYAIHSKIGDKCVGAKINNKMVPLTTQLNNGDIVEIITNINSKGPSRDWLKICKTAGAKTKINAFFKKEMKDENIKKGKAILESQAKIRSLNLSKLLNDDFLLELFEKYSLTSIDDMYASLGYGGINSSQILNKLKNLYDEKNNLEQVKNLNYEEKTQTIYDSKIIVKGFSNLLTKLAKCCNPIPGDELMGYISRGKGVTVHRADCVALKNYEFERLIECKWNSSPNSKYIGSLNVITTNMQGAVAKISKKINDNKINIGKISSKTISDNRILIYVQVFINKKEDLDELINKLKQFNFVYDAYRNG